MPTTLTYPGVYVEEIPSGVRSITGVATSVTAFMGRAPRGPVSVPVTINSFSDYQRTYGGLSLDSPMSYAVKDFFSNGGSQAIIVRLYRPQSSTAAGSGAGSAPVAVQLSGLATLTLDSLQLVATNPGCWGNKLTAAVTYPDPSSPMTSDVASSLGVAVTDLFNLTVILNLPSFSKVETFVNLTFKDTKNRVDRVLAQSSNFVRVASDPNHPGNALIPSTSSTSPTRPAATTQNSDGSLAFVSAASGSGLDSAPLQAADYAMTTLDTTDIFNLLCIPPDVFGGDTDPGVYLNAMNYCAQRRAILLVDPPNQLWKGKTSSQINVSDLKLTGPNARNAAVYYPRVLAQNSLRNGQTEEFVACGMIAGIIARTDAQRGVWKAPAGIDAALSGVGALTIKLTDADSGALNPQGINCLRSFPVSGPVVWGARTLRGSELLSDDYKYLSVRRLALYIEESVYRGTQWAVFEPNAEPLWAQIRMTVGSFMQTLFRQGAFAGQSATEAYFVKCDSESTAAADINAGIVNVIVGFAPLKPAEFVVIQFQQMAGQVTS